MASIFIGALAVGFVGGEEGVSTKAYRDVVGAPRSGSVRPEEDRWHCPNGRMQDYARWRARRVGRGMLACLNAPVCHATCTTATMTGGISLRPTRLNTAWWHRALRWKRIARECPGRARTRVP